MKGIPLDLVQFFIEEKDKNMHIVYKNVEIKVMKVRKNRRKKGYRC